MMNINKIRLLLCEMLLLLFFLASPALAEPVLDDLVLIANANSGIEHLTKREVVNIYLGRYRRLDIGSTAEPIDLSSKTDAKSMFYRLLVDKNLAEINAYWSRLVFSGKTRPPQQADSIDEVLEIVGHNRNALGYVDRASVNSEVVIVFEWSDT
jgi:ABC-type phosphate transport system substrate-binding protein